MIGGNHDLNPFGAFPDNGGLGQGFRPRGDPIYGPGSTGIFEPGRGLGTDDDVYTQPFNPLREPTNNNPRGPNRRGRGGFGGGFGSGFGGGLI